MPKDLSAIFQHLLMPALLFRGGLRAAVFTAIGSRVHGLVYCAPQKITSHHDRRPPASGFFFERCGAAKNSTTNKQTRKSQVIDGSNRVEKSYAKADYCVIGWGLANARCLQGGAVYFPVFRAMLLNAVVGTFLQLST